MSYELDELRLRARTIQARGVLHASGSFGARSRWAVGPTGRPGIRVPPVGATPPSGRSALRSRTRRRGRASGAATRRTSWPTAGPWPTTGHPPRTLGGRCPSRRGAAGVAYEGDVGAGPSLSPGLEPGSRASDARVIATSLRELVFRQSLGRRAQRGARGRHGPSEIGVRGIEPPWAGPRNQCVATTLHADAPYSGRPPVARMAERSRLDSNQEFGLRRPA